MKLSEALALRADLHKRVQQMQQRLRLSAVVQEGESPPENPGVLFAELDSMLRELQDLIARINQTNLQAVLPNGRSLTQALAERDVLRLRLSILRPLAQRASERSDRYSRTEIRNIATIDVGEMRRDIDRLSKQYRELDTAIQGVNWSVELLE